MDNIYKFRANTSIQHLQHLNNDKQFYSEDESSETKQNQQFYLKQISKPPSKMSHFSQNITGYQTDDSDKDSQKDIKRGPTSQKLSKFRNLVNSIEGDIEGAEEEREDDVQTDITQSNYEDPTYITNKTSKLQWKMKQYNNEQIFLVKLQRNVNSDIEYSTNKQQCKLSNHPFRHLIYGPLICENVFNKFLQLTQRGLIYATRSLKEPCKKYIKSKTLILPDAKIPKSKTLLLDLDETLIHSCSARDKYQICILAFNEQGEQAKIYLNIRPFCQWFLQQMSLLYTIYVYTASSSAYASTIVKYLDPKGQFISGILSRQNCLETKHGFYIKDLRIISNKQIKNMLIVDNLAHSFGFQIENGIPILEWNSNIWLLIQWRQLIKKILDYSIKTNLSYLIQLNINSIDYLFLIMGSCYSQVPYTFPDGGIYDGEIKDGLPDGKGKIIWDNGTQFEGYFEKGKKVKKGVFKWGDSSHYEGEFLNENFHGYGEYYWYNGKVYKGNWVNGKMEGQGTLCYDGKEYIGEFKNDKKDGQGELRWPNGQKYIGYWKNGKQDGIGKLIEPNGNVIEGKWVKGKKL
ncbi:unnamed protein product [Paramecium pentaurelia]|uniref:FCP1 homology domain-containing protein n=1 Tax=Paramecium pentaurelia TaxID=43138 RepID=A0A8S1UFH1_9CILI|nr:unnamed protein product [Paramecium pentaurelia]